MNRYYRIYCTQEQTKKALELGAPIGFEHKNTVQGILEKHEYIICNGIEAYFVPTAEQMIEWLEEQWIYIIVPIPLIKDFNKNDFSKADAFEYRIVINGNEPYSGEYLTSKEATLAAIDVALDYLSKNKR